MVFSCESIEGLHALNLKSKSKSTDRLNLRKAKILITLGPASREAEVVEQLLEAGANAARTNMSPGNPDEKALDIERARAAGTKMGRRLTRLCELLRPKTRTAAHKATARV